MWPHFHNGVAEGLRLAALPSAERWTPFHKPAPGVDGAHAHAGLLCGLALRGFLRHHSHTSLLEYLSQNDVPTSVGLLLGLAGGARGSLDPWLARTLASHVRALRPPHAVALEVAPLVHSAALVATGLLYQGSGHRRVVEAALGEIGRAPGSRPGAEGDREGHALAAGLALGFTLLGRGDQELTDLRLPERLARLMSGGPKLGPGNHLPPPPMYAAAGLSAASFDFGGPRFATGLGADPHAMTTGAVREGANVNTNVTAPGATLALGLMYLRTHDAAAAALLAVPDTAVRWRW